MVANLQTTVPSQDFLYRAEQVMTARLNWDSPASVDIGGLPANAAITDVVVHTQTAFNAATNNNINIGFRDSTATNATAYVAGAAIGPVGVAKPSLATTAVPLSRPTTVTMAYAPSGGGQSAGTALVTVKFVTQP